MQLRNARLCLDCEEVHDSQQCPVCTSESFAFVTRWIPAGERRDPNRPPARPRAQTPAPKKRSWVARSLAGMAVIAIGQAVLRRNKQTSTPEP